MKPEHIAVLCFVVAAVAIGATMSFGGDPIASGFSVTRIVNGEADAGQKVKLQAQVLSIQSEFKPIAFVAADIREDGTPASLSDPNIRIRYDGHDQIRLESYAHVSLEGSWDSASKTFHADKLSTKCPTRYENKSTEELKPQSTDP